jgi:diguanylate cyclase (GGDEF)-like protein
MSAPVAPRLSKIRAAGAAAGAIGLCIYAVHVTVGSPGPDALYTKWLFATLFAIAIALLLLRVTTVATERGPWLAFAAGLCAFLAGWIAYWLFVEGQPEPVYPSISDAFWLMGSVLEYYALVLLLRARSVRFHAAFLLDGAIGVLALAALSAAVVFHKVLDITGGSTSAVLVNLAYPLVDLAFVATVVTVFALSGWRPGRTWVVIGLAFTIQAVADSVLLYQLASGSYHQGTVLDVSLPLAAMLLPLAAWMSAERRGELRLEGWRMLAVPGGFTLLAIGLLVRGSLSGLAPAAALLATATLAVAAVRSVTAFRGMLTLSASHERAVDAALRDHLTGLFNHRAFHESLEQALGQAHARGETLSLITVDLVGLKETNDTHGHQAGDERLTLLAATLMGVLRTGDSAYRVGGDEFAVILPGVQAWDAFNVGNRLQHTLSGDHGAPAPAVSIGVTEAEPGMGKDEVIGRADAALIEAKRSHRKTVLYSVGLELQREAMEATLPRVHTKVLATALARAVDAKDSYLHSHCETVSEMCVMIASALQLEPARVEKLRLAGLLHDVGKIGVPDSILQKPAPLTDTEYETMKTHSRLGHSIVSGAGLLEEAGWILHHHERPDGTGYPDGLQGDDLPLESRIILVADAFEAITSDRPYRNAQTASAALTELNLHVGTQFDPECVAALERALTSRRPALAPKPA